MPNSVLHQDVAKDEYELYVRGNSYKQERNSFKTGVDSAFKYLEDRNRINKPLPVTTALVVAAWAFGIMVGVFIATI